MQKAMQSVRTSCLAQPKGWDYVRIRYPYTVLQLTIGALNSGIATSSEKAGLEYKIKESQQGASRNSIGN